MQEHNEVLLTKELLTRVLTYLSVRLFARFQTTVHIVIHGGAVMVLHRSLSCRKSTRDVDYNHRSFESHWMKRGVSDAGARLSLCIEETARAFNLGADWMNAHADVALPMARGAQGELIDPIYNDALTPQNMAMNTIFESQGLVMVAVSWSWAVALKLIRYQKDDPNDIAAILKLGTEMRGCKWTVELIEGWLNKLCSPMGYKNYSPNALHWNRVKMQDAIRRAQQLNWGAAAMSYQAPPTLVPWWFQQQQSSQRPAGQPRPMTMTEGMIEHEQVLNSQERFAAARRRTRSFSGPVTHSSSSSSSRSLSQSASCPSIPPMPVTSVPAHATAPTAVPVYYHTQPPQRQRHMSVSVPPQPAAPVIHSVPYGHSHQSAPRRPSTAVPPPPAAAISIQNAPPTVYEKLPPGFVPAYFVPRVYHQAVHRVAMVG